MIIDNLNLNHLRIFESVYRMRSMTAASKELHLTQSGVSQHIKSLEEMLETKLFDRIRQKLVPTSDASLLFRECTQGLYQIEQVITKLKKATGELEGSVSVGMPIEFGKNVVTPLLAEFGKKHQRVSFKMKLGFAFDMNEMLLNGSIDFALIDEFSMDKRIETERVYDEILGLYAHREFLQKYSAVENTKKYFESLAYIAYQDAEPVLRRWFDHHLKQRHLNLRVKAVVMNVQAVARLITMGSGAGVLPGHYVARRGKDDLYLFEGSGKPLKNAISIAYLRERTHSPVTRATIDFLKHSFEKRGRSFSKGRGRPSPD